MNYLSEVLRNAVSLVDDADLLYQHHRYARAVALAALSMEEIGKFYIMKWKKDDQLTLIRKHVAIDMANSVLDEISAALAEIGFCLIHEDEMSDRQKQWVFSERGQKFHKEFLESQETLNRVPEAIRQSIGAGVLKDLYAGQVDAIKQKSLYADFDISGNLVSTPQDISEEVARQYIDYAKRVIQRIGIVDDRASSGQE